MKIQKATLGDLADICEICSICIVDCYGKYYPAGAVEHFLEYHNRDKIKDSVINGEIYVAFEDERAVGTVSVTENEIHRFFVLPSFQGRGIGSEMLELCEKEIAKSYDTFRLDAALGSYKMYEKRGYKTDDYIAYECENGDFLCYFIMSKNAR